MVGAFCYEHCLHILPSGISVVLERDRIIQNYHFCRDERGSTNKAGNFRGKK